MEAKSLRVIGGTDPPNPCEQFDEVLPAALLMSDELSGTSKLTAALLWALAGRNADTVVRVRFTDLALSVGVTERAMRDVIDQLETVEFVGRFESRRGRGGGCELRVFGPAKLCESFRLRKGADANQRSLWPLGEVTESPGHIGICSDVPGDSPPIIGVLRTENSDLETPALRARAPAHATKDSIPKGIESNTTPTSTSTSKLYLKEPGASALGGDAADRKQRIFTRCREMSDALSRKYSRPHVMQKKFIVLAALLEDGGDVEVYAGWRKLRVTVAAHDVRSVLAAALSGEASGTTKRFYNLLKDRLRRAAEADVRMPGDDAIRAACERVGVPWSDEWRLSPAELWQRHCNEEAAR